MTMTYSRSTHVMSSEYDEAFRLLTTMLWAGAAGIRKIGRVEDESGKLSALDVDSNARHYLLSNGENVPSEGWYIVHENISRQIVVFSYESAAERDQDFSEFCPCLTCESDN